MKRDPTLNEWAAFWMETYVRPAAKPSGYEHYHDNLYKHILPVLGEYRLSRLTTPIVQELLNEKAKHGNLKTGGPLSAKSIKNMRVVLDTCCKRAVADGYMPANPVPGTVYKRCSTGRVEVMSDAHQKILEEWLFQDPSLINSGIMLGLYSGMRLGEVCAVRWKHYDFERGCLHISETVRRISQQNPDAAYGQRTKLVFSAAKTQASERNLFLADVLQDLMVRQYERYTEMFGVPPTGEDFIIFNSDGRCMDPDNLSHYFGEVLKGLGLPHIKYHALRHTFATRAVERGVDIATVSGLLGHADVTTTTHYYVHPREESMRRAMNTMGPISQTYTRRYPYTPVGAAFRTGTESAEQTRVCRRQNIGRSAICDQ